MGKKTIKIAANDFVTSLEEDWVLAIGNMQENIW